MPSSHNMQSFYCGTTRPSATFTKLARLGTYLFVIAFLVSSKLSLGGSRVEAMSNLTVSEVKAAHLFKFKKYVEWPAEALPEGDPVVVGVVGAEDVAEALERLVLQRDATRRKVEVLRVLPGDSLAGIHILYVGKDKALELTQWLSRAQGKPILCVTDSGNGMPPGSMINFVQDDERTRFDISLTAAERSQIKLSAALLTVARQVYGGKS